MGNTPSTQASPARGGGGMPKGMSPQLSHNSPPTAPTTASSSLSSRQPNLRLPMPQRPNLTSPHSSENTTPTERIGGRSGSPRRRKSLELPDLNRLSFTPAAPVPTLATHTSHHLAPSTPAAAVSASTSASSQIGQTPSQGHVKRKSTGSSVPPGDDGSPSRRWRMSLGGKHKQVPSGREISSSVPIAPRTAPIDMPSSSQPDNPYFPSSPSPPNKAASMATSPRDRGRSSLSKQSIPIAIPGRKALSSQSPPPPAQKLPEAAAAVSAGPSGIVPPPPPPTLSATPQPNGELAETQDGLVSVPIKWEGGGKNVFVTGNFANNWKGRFKLLKSPSGYETTLRLPPGQYRLKFIVDDSWRCSKLISTATDDDGTLVNWLEVEAPKTEDEMRSEWAMDSKPAAKHEDTDDSQWTSTIPAPLVLYQYLEELPLAMNTEQWSTHFQNVPHLTSVPQPPMLPRILDKVIVNAEPKKLWSDQPSGTATPAGLDDNSILAVPNHVVLNHLTASAIKNGTLGVGTTTRYRKKYITTMYFKPTLGDLMEGTQNQSTPALLQSQTLPSAEPTNLPDLPQEAPVEAPPSTEA